MYNESGKIRRLFARLFMPCQQSTVVDLAGTQLVQVSTQRSQFSVDDVPEVLSNATKPPMIMLFEQGKGTCHRRLEPIITATDARVDNAYAVDLLVRAELPSELE
jgi:hypothetical protein